MEPPPEIATARATRKKGTAAAARPRASRSSMRGMRSGGKAMAEEQPDNGDPVTPADLLAGGPRPRGEADRRFGNAMTGLEQAGSNLRLDVEPIRRQSETACHRRAHDLVAGLHVRNRGPVQDVRQGSEYPVGSQREPWGVGAR